jgi:hypothetical protein
MKNENEIIEKKIKKNEKMMKKFDEKHEIELEI